jgi:glycosyltransferase involved in cell wall biosynthesis
MNPLVSVVVTSYNQREKLERAVNSVLQQSFPDIEIIIVDDFSTDDSGDYIRQLAAIHPHKVKFHFQKKNVGIPANKNTGFKMASGDFITYLDGDDFYYDRKIESELKVFEADHFVSAVYSNYQFAYEDGRVKKTWAAEKDIMPCGNIFDAVICGSFPSGMMPRCEMYKKEVLYELNFYNEVHPIYHDFDFMIRYTSQFRVGYSSYIGSAYCENPVSIVAISKMYKLAVGSNKVLQDNKPMILSKSSSYIQFFKKHKKNHSINLLFVAPSVSLFDWIKNLFRYPDRLSSIAKAFYSRYIIRAKYS